MIVIPMAGYSSRFFKAGYTVPKYMLDLGCESVFEWSLSSFKDYYKSDFFLFIIFDQYNTYDFVEEMLKKIGIEKYKIITLTERTLGQADTVYQGIKEIVTDDEMYIFNIDSRLKTFKKMEEFPEKDGYLEVFIGDGEHWSFVQSGENNQVLKTTEKIRISNLCSNGLYYFKSIQLYKKYFNEKLEKKIESELYIAPMYNNYIRDGKNIVYKLVESSDIEFCGTPQEYLETLNKI